MEDLRTYRRFYGDAFTVECPTGSGRRVTLDMIEQICIEPSGALTDEDRSAIARWRLHLGALVGYQAPDPEWLQ